MAGSVITLKVEFPEGDTPPDFGSPLGELVKSLAQLKVRHIDFDLTPEGGPTPGPNPAPNVPAPA